MGSFFTRCHEGDELCMMEEFLDSISHDIKNPFVRHKIRKELQNHIEEARDASSLSEKEIINDMGNPKEIAEEFNKVYKDRGILKILLTLSLVGMLIYTATQLYAIKHTFANNNFTLYPGEKEEIDKKIDSVYELNDEITLGNIHLNFKKLYTLKDGRTVLLYKASKVNPFLISDTVYSLKGCREFECFNTDFISMNNYGINLMQTNQSLIVVNTEKTPDTLYLEFVHVGDKDKVKVLTVEKGGRIDE